MQHSRSALYRSWSGATSGVDVGWRSWNAFGPRITQDMMVQAVDAMVAKNRTVAGWEGKVSLCDLGYCSVGIDEGWEVIDSSCSHSLATSCLRPQTVDVIGLW